MPQERLTPRVGPSTRTPGLGAASAPCCVKWARDCAGGWARPPGPGLEGPRWALFWLNRLMPSKDSTTV